MPISAPPPSWESIKSKPTTLGGFGITDALANGQTWQNVVASRSGGVTYTNTTGKPIVVSISGTATDSVLNAVVNGVYAFQSLCRSTYFNYVPISFVVPIGGTYSIQNMTYLASWAELRS